MLPSAIRTCISCYKCQRFARRFSTSKFVWNLLFRFNNSGMVCLCAAMWLCTSSRFSFGTGDTSLSLQLLEIAVWLSCQAPVHLCMHVTVSQALIVQVRIQVRHCDQRHDRCPKQKAIPVDWWPGSSLTAAGFHWCRQASRWGHLLVF